MFVCQSMKEKNTIYFKIKAGLSYTTHYNGHLAVSWQLMKFKESLALILIIYSENKTGIVLYMKTMKYDVIIVLVSIEASGVYRVPPEQGLFGCLALLWVSSSSTPLVSSPLPCCCLRSLTQLRASNCCYTHKNNDFLPRLPSSLSLSLLPVCLLALSPAPHSLSSLGQG